MFIFHSYINDYNHTMLFQSVRPVYCIHNTQVAIVAYVPALMQSHHSGFENGHKQMHCLTVVMITHNVEYPHQEKQRIVILVVVTGHRKCFSVRAFCTAV